MEFIEILIDLFIDMSFYIMIGLLLVGILHVFVKKDWIIKQLGSNSITSVIKSSLIGVPLPLCSCGVIPTAIEMKKSGASNGAVISFLISTPQTGVDNIIATWGLLGPFMAVFRAISAFVSGIIGGIIVNIFCFKEEVKEVKQSCCCTNKKNDAKEEYESLANKIKRVFKYSFFEFLDEISLHLILGIFVSAIISVLIPEDFFIGIGLDSGILAMLLMVVIGLPMYICSTSSIPIALSLVLKGLSPGAAFVFLFTGPVTNIASLIVLAKTFSKKVIAIYLGSVVILSIISGYIFDYMIGIFGIDLHSHLSHAGHMKNDTVANTLAIIFFVLLTTSMVKKLIKKFKVV